MRKLLGIALGIALLAAAHAAPAQLRNTASSKLRMVHAYCTTGPCDQFFTFQSGATLVKRIKEPHPVTNRKIGKVRINGLTRLGGVPIPLRLDAQLSGTTFYGQDMNAICPLANTTTSGLIATSTMNCIVTGFGDANCAGDLFFTSLVPPACSDVTQVIQDLTVEVYEDGFVGIPEHLLAVFGANILGKSPDCASGGAGCP